MRSKSVLVAIVALAVGLGSAVIPAFAATLKVTDYGAVPNDAGDDRAAIDAAITAAASGDTVYFPSGTYCVSRSVVGKSGIRLEGTTGSVLQYVGTTADCFLSLHSVSDVTVAGLTLDGENSGKVSQGISAGNASKIVLRNLTIQNLGKTDGWGPHGILFDPAVTDSSITNNKITNIATSSAWGAGIRLSNGSSRNIIESNAISNTGRGGILCNDACTDLVVRANTITGSGGVGLGIELWGGCPRGLIEDNRVDHWISLDSSDFCAVRRNTVSDKSGIYKFAGLEAIAQNCVFTDNLIDGGAQVGISLSGVSPKEYVLWARNTVKACGTWATQLQGDSGGIAYQYFYRNKFLSAKRNDPQAMYPNQGNGFRFNDNCHYVSLDSNEIKDNEGDGIQFSSGLSQLSFTNNVIRGNSHASISGSSGSDLEWSGNTVSGNGSNVKLSSEGFTNHKPVAAFTCPATVLPGQTVSFWNKSHDPDGSIDRVLWDFDDGIPATDRNPTHVYAKTGSHTVTLVVWDNLGRGMLATKTITVADKPSKGK